MLRNITSECELWDLVAASDLSIARAIIIDQLLSKLVQEQDKG